LPFDFTFYNVTYPQNSTIQICPTGYIGFNTSYDCRDDDIDTIGNSTFGHLGIYTPRAEGYEDAYYLVEGKKETKKMI